MELFDAIVVGGGPAGSLVAQRLSSSGHSVLVLEKKDRVGKETCCTGIISRECYERFPVDPSAILQEAKSASLMSPSGNLMRVNREKTQAYIVDRYAYDASLAQIAQDVGVRYIFRHPVTQLTLEKDCIVAHTAGEGDTCFTARVVVIANGFASKIPATFGMGRINNFVTGAQAEVAIKHLDEVEIYTGREVAPGFFAWLVPTFDNKALAGLLSSHNGGEYLRNFISCLIKKEKISPGKYDIKYAGIPLKPLPRTFAERMLVVGDAAGQVKPTTGGGIYFSLLCAEIAAGTLHHALNKNDFSAGQLADYERTWHKKLSRELRIDYWAHRIYGGFSDDQLEYVFDIIKDKNIARQWAQDERLSFDWHADLVLQLFKHHALQGLLLKMKFPIGGPGFTGKK